MGFEGEELEHGLMNEWKQFKHDMFKSFWNKNNVKKQMVDNDGDFDVIKYDIMYS